MKNITIIEENIKLSEGLMGEYNRIFTDIVCYLRVSRVSEEEQEEIISDTVMMFLDWQEEGKTVESMIGKDYKKYTESIISAVNPKTNVLKTFKNYLGLIVECFCMIFTVDFVFLYLPKLIKRNPDFNVNYNYTSDMLLRGLIVASIFLILINYIGKNAFELSKKHFSKLANFIFGCSVAVVLILLVLISKLGMDVVIFSINIRYIMGIIVVYWVYKVIKKTMK